ncbi:hypothetical protein D3C71_1855860 [compost metagenome]
MAANSELTSLNGKTSTDSVSIMHSGSPDQFVTILRSPEMGIRHPSASQDQTDPAVARLVPRSTSWASSFARSSLSPKMHTS